MGDVDFDADMRRFFDRCAMGADFQKSVYGQGMIQEGGVFTQEDHAVMSPTESKVAQLPGFVCPGPAATLWVLPIGRGEGGDSEGASGSVHMWWPMGILRHSGLRHPTFKVRFGAGEVCVGSAVGNFPDTLWCPPFFEGEWLR